MQRRKDSDSYVKFLAVIDIIIRRSDEHNPVTVDQIKEYLSAIDYDFEIDSRAVKKYVQFYNDYYNEDVIVSYKQGRNNYFYFTNDVLDYMEAKAILDLVYSSDFFTQTTKQNYKKKLQSMFTVHYQSHFEKVLNAHMDKNASSDVFYKELEVISKAIVQGKKITFKYHKPSINEGVEKEHTLAPIDTYFSNNEYYLLCQGAKDREYLVMYRLDYIKDVKIIDEDFEITDYEKNLFERKLQMISYMYGEGEEESVTLEFNEELYPNMIDKFGKDIVPVVCGDGKYIVHVRTQVNSTFYSWVVGFGGKIQIVDPHQSNKFKTFLKQQFLL